MSLWNPFGIFTGGIDLDEQQRLSDERDAQKAILDERARQRGLWTPEQSAGVEARAAASAIDVKGQVSEEFYAGLAEGTENVRKTIGGGVTQAILTPLKLIPWQVWLILGVVLLLYMGGGVWLAKQLKGRLAK